MPDEVGRDVNHISSQGGTPLVVVDGSRVMGTIFLKDIVKGGIRERFAKLREMGIRNEAVLNAMAAVPRHVFVEEALASGDQTAAAEALKNAQPELQRGVSKGVLHKNTASRKVSRLSARVKAMG